VYTRDRKQWWALIPAYVLLAVGLMVTLLESGILSDLLVPAYVMFAVAIPFLVVYARNRQHWWALIPSGILIVIGIAFLIAEAALEFILPVVFIILGVGILVRVFTRKELPEAEPSIAEPEVEEPPAE
jgi:predicted membrane protein